MNGYARFRDVRQAPDGKIYAITESPNRFVLLRSNVPVFNSTEEGTGELKEKDVLYPNPSVGESTLSFYVSTKQFVTIRIFSTNGLLIKELTAQNFAAGRHSLEIESEKLPQGFYFIEVDKGGTKTLTKFIKM
jgi:hypothetical protein